MTNETYTMVGKLGKPHGISGAFRFLLQRELKSKAKFPKHFMVQVKGSFLPWFIQSVEWIGFNEGFILFEEITSPERAKQFSGAELFMAAKDVQIYLKKQSQDIDYLIGYSISDKAMGEIGIIEEMIENPGQILLSVKHQGREVMIPFVEDFVVDINTRKKQILVDLPEGLLEL